jgi:uncharacterized protein YpmS
MGKRVNSNWRLLFFLLLTLNVITIGYLSVQLTRPLESAERENDNQPLEEHIKFLVSTDKQDLNQYINHYIKKTFKQQDLDYYVALDDFVVLNGEVPVFSSKIDYQLLFDPKVEANGNILLSVNEIKLGRLNLPVHLVLENIHKYYRFPNWIEVIPEEEAIYVAVSQIKIRNDTSIHVHSFDLKNNDLSFYLNVPVDQ